ncbi:MAG: AAA family ATPase [Kiloniellales bacterium]
MQDSGFDRAVLARYAARALESAAGEPYVVRNIVEWLVGQESVLLLALPRALVECVRRLRSEETEGLERASSFAACYGEHRGELMAALDDAARSAADGPDPLAVNLAMLAREFELNDTELAILEVAARYARSSLVEGFCSLLERNLKHFAKVVACLLGTSRQSVLAAVLPSASLVRSGLVQVNPQATDVSGCDGYVEILPALDDQLDRSFACFEEFCDAVLGKTLEARLAWQDFAHVAEGDLIARVLKGALDRGSEGVNILLYGPPGCGKTELCKTLAAKLGLSLIPVGEAAESGLQITPSRRLAGLSLAQRLLRRRSDAVLLFDEMEDLLGSPDDRRSASKLFFNRLLENNRVPVLWTCNDVTWFDPAFLRRMTLVVEMKVPGPGARARVWGRLLRGSSVEMSPAELERLAERIEVAPAVAANALRAADLAQGGAPEVYQAMQGLAKALNDGRPLDLSAGNATAFVPALAKADHDLELLTAKLVASGARAFSLCLSGPSGTGKSAYARHLSKALGLRSLQKRASDLLDMYVGESEKRIARAFEEAREGNAFLIFDEADSLLGDRRDAGHSWEISQVNEMLTWMESHPLPFCCTTNLMDRLDPASLRRFTFNVKFDYLDPFGIALACARFFGAAFSERGDLEADLAGLPNLTPGDFAAVRRKAGILGLLDDGAELSRLLVAASEAKPGRAAPIGFLR